MPLLNLILHLKLNYPALDHKFTVVHA